MNVFWLIWLITVIPVIISTVITWHFVGNNGDPELFVVLPIIITSAIFAIISYVLGLKFIIGLSSFDGKITWYMWAIELILLVIYASLMLYFMFATNYVSNNRAKIKKKINYLRKMVGELNVAMLNIKDLSLKQSVENLRDSIKYSDPMGSAEVEELEQTLYFTVSDIIEKINAGADLESCKVQLQKANAVLTQRNEEIKYSK